MATRAGISSEDYVRTLVNGEAIVLVLYDTIFNSLYSRKKKS